MIDNSNKINWFPGHMKRGMDIIDDHLSFVDCVIEVVDSRVPMSSANPMLKTKINKKFLLRVFSKIDLADMQRNVSLIKENETNILMNIKQDKKNRIITLLKNKNIKNVLIVGIPNVGKSSLINLLSSKKKTSVSNIPAHTRNKQYVKIDDTNINLIDTPGVLWPKIDDQDVAVKLGIVGSIKEQIIGIERLASEFITLMYENERYKKMLFERYKIDDALLDDGYDILDLIGKNVGALLKGGKIDYERTSRMLIKDFRDGKIGKITLD